MVICAVSVCLSVCLSMFVCCPCPSFYWSPSVTLWYCVETILTVFCSRHQIARILVFKLSFITISVLTGSVPRSSKFYPTRVGKPDNSETFSAVSRKKLICDPCYYMSLIGSRIHIMSYRISIGISISVTLNDPYDQRGSTVLTHHLT